MCLAVPNKVIEVQPDGPWAIVETLGLQSQVGLHLVGPVQPGEYLLIHAGIAIAKIDLQEAERQIQLLEEILSAEHR